MISAGECIATLPVNEVVFLGPAEAQARAGWPQRAVYEAIEAGRTNPPPPRSSRPVRPPRRFYKPIDQSQLHPRFEIFDRATGQVLARVRGTREFIHNEALKLAQSHGGSLRDLVIKIEVPE
jgi:hypothetical protein